MGKLLLTVVKGVPGTDPLHTVAGTPYFSNLHRLMQRKLPNVATPEQARGLAASAGHYPGGEPGDEAQWTGFHSFVSGMQPGQKFVKSDLLSHMGDWTRWPVEQRPGIDSRPPLQWRETPRGMESGGYNDDEGHRISYWGGAYHAEVGKGRGERRRYKEIGKFASRAEAERAAEASRGPVDTFHRSLSGEGGSKYSETILRHKDHSFANPYHYDGTQGIVGSLRSTVRGKGDDSSVHIEEIQSDLHQNGRKGGYFDHSLSKPGPGNPGVEYLSNFLSSNPDVLERWSKFYDPRGQFSQSPARIAAAFLATSSGSAHPKVELDARYEGDSGASAADAFYHAQGLNSDALRAAAMWQENEKRPMPAPLAKNWHEVMFRRALYDAASRGVARLTWAPGQEHADRYRLDLHFNRVLYNRDQHRLVAYPSRGNPTPRVISNVSPEKLPEYIGEDAAKLLLSRPADDTRSQVLTGQDLRIGGEGMRGFYGHIIPGEDPMGSDHDIVDHGIIGRYANAYARKLHGRPDAPQVEASSVAGRKGERRPAFSLRITPQMRERILREGVPLWGHTDSSATDAIRKAVAVGEIESEVPTHGVLTMKAFVYGVDNPYRPAGITRPGRHSLTPTLRIAPNTARVRPPRLLTVVGMSAHNPSTIFHAPAAHDQVVNPVQVVPRTYAPSRSNVPAASPTTAPVVRHISSTQTEGGGMHHLLWSATPGHGAAETRDELRARGFVLQPGTWKKSRGGASHIFAATAPDGATHTFHVFRANTIGQSGASFNEPPAAPAPASGAPN